ncbi:MAG: hypothetical protein AAGA66_11910 [Bacteroidota bacterium]
MNEIIKNTCIFRLTRKKGCLSNLIQVKAGIERFQTPTRMHGSYLSKNAYDRQIQRNLQLWFFHSVANES